MNIFLISFDVRDGSMFTKHFTRGLFVTLREMSLWGEAIFRIGLIVYVDTILDTVTYLVIIIKEQEDTSRIQTSPAV